MLIPVIMNLLSKFPPFLFLVIICFHFPLITTAEDTDLQYKYFIDLTSIENDQLLVELEVPQMNEEEVIFQLPKIVPGTYSIYDFGRFISNFRAFDQHGDELEVEQMDINSWKIKEAQSLHKITYLSDDTFDAPSQDNYVFQPAGTSFEADEVYVLNTHTFLGYFKDLKDVKYQLEIKKPEGFYGSTSLVADTRNEGTDIFTAPSYIHLTDAPIMYNLPDTTTLSVGNTQVLISAYSASKTEYSMEIASHIEDVLNAHKEYMGGVLPVDKYAFIIYFGATGSPDGSIGALEHNQSSFYALHEKIPRGKIMDYMKDFAAHEFYHIVTPLTIHSEQIRNFDYNDPQMSQHLWLYEGVTEYNASYPQLKYGLMDLSEYFDEIIKKITYTEKVYNDTLAFTELSKNVLDKYEKQYGNVYQKGALIGLNLDILLRHYSDGEYGLQDLMNDLMNKYGRDRPFEDDNLFSVITEFTYPEIGEFLQTHVAGTKPLPMKETFDKVGINYEKNAVVKDISLGGFKIGLNPQTRQLYVVDTQNLDEFGKSLGYLRGDTLYAINGQEVDIENLGSIVEDYKRNTKPGDKVVVSVLRQGKKDKTEIVKLKARAIEVDRVVPYQITLDENPSPRQLQIRNSWLNNS
ncbi:peptidase M61 [soil metagenome]